MTEEKQEKLGTKIVPRIIQDEMKQSYLDYSMSVIVGRALPDVRDGLKPVHRRVLYTMWEVGLLHNKPFKKSANVVGNCMARFHPHGDAAIYDTLVRLAQDFSMRYPLVDGQGNFGCFTADTKVKLTDGRDLSFEELIIEHKQGKRNYTFTIDENGLIKIAEIKNLRLTKKNAEIMKVILDNGEEIKCTLNHKFMLRNRSYKEARELCSGDSLMPAYFGLCTKEEDPNMAGYSMILQPKSSLWDYVHVLSDEWNLENGDYTRSAGRIRHHIDFNKLNNNPDNIRRIGWKEHWQLHYNLTSAKHKNSPEYKLALANGRKKFWDNGLNRKINSERMTQRNLRNWKNKKYREQMRKTLSEINKEYIKNHPEKRIEFSERATKTLKRLWQIPAYREVFHNKIIACNKRRITNLTGKKKFLNLCRYLKENNLTIDKENYEKIRKEVFEIKSFTSWDLGIRKYYKNDKNLILCEINGNHKVRSIEFLNKFTDVYDLTIENTHNFALGAGIFVHNSIDGDPAAAMRYCVTGDSFIITEKGLIKIDELSDKENIGIKVLSKDKKINKASKWFDSGYHPTLRITTHKGYSLSGSKNHPVLTISKDETGKPIFLWKLLENIGKGDYVVIDRSSDSLWPREKADLSQYYPKIKKTTNIRKLPKHLDEDLAFILGAFVAEGSLTDIKIEFCNSDETWVNSLVEVWNRVFPDSKMHKFKRKPNSYGKKEYYRIECHCRYTLEFLRNIGLDSLKSSERQIPKTILQSPKEVVASFFKSYFEGDGSISYSRKMIELSCCSKSEKLITEVQTSLLRFGIDSFKRFDKHKLLWKLYLRGYRNILRFYKEIGFISDYKNKKLEFVVYSYKKDNSLYDYVPFVSDYIRNLTNSEFVTKHNFDRYSNMKNNYEKVSSILLQETETDFRPLFEYLLTYNYLFDQVIQVDETGIQKVYSIKVESNCHSFISNGFISHNTECRLTKLAEEMLEDIDKRTVKFTPNFDNSTTEPAIMPSKLPNLLVNGSSGIAVGMATNIPPHNLGEVIDATIKQIDNPDLTVEEIMSVVQGPDFPTGASICGKAGIRDAYTSGRGKIIVRAKTSIEQTKSKPVIIVSEIPFMVNKSELLEEMADLVRDKKIVGIADLRDESDRTGIRIVIELKKDADANVLLNQLFQHTRMQTTFGVITLALVNNEPKILNIKQLIHYHIAHRKDVVRKRTLFDLNKAQIRAHVLEGLIIALANINGVIKLVKESKSVEAARGALTAKFNLTSEQATAILEMRLQRLTSLEQEKIRQEHSELLKLIEELESILANPQKILDIIKKELRELKDKYSDARRTQIIEGEETELETEDLIKDEEMAITITNSGYIKRLPLQTYKLQRRGGKGVIAAATKEEDIVKDIFVASTHSYILFFTNKGKVYWLKVYGIPEASRQARGKAIVNLLELANDENVTAFVPVRNFDAKSYLIMVTKKGTVKKTELMAYSNPRKHGIIAITLEQGDELINVALTDGNQQIILATKKGIAVRFEERNVRPTGRSAQGVRGISLKDNDEVIGMVVASDEKTLLSVTENGYGKRTPIDDYRLINRGGSGVINIQCSERNGNVVSICSVTDNDGIMFVSKNGIIIRVPATDISVIGRNTQGVRIMKLDDNDKVVAAVKVVGESNGE